MRRSMSAGDFRGWVGQIATHVKGRRLEDMISAYTET